MSERLAIEALHQENSERYGTDEQRGMLDTLLPRTFPAPWIFLFELTQNAIDAGAKNVRVTTGAGTLAFEHDGTQPLDLSHVKALSRASPPGCIAEAASAGDLRCFRFCRRSRATSSSEKSDLTRPSATASRIPLFPDPLGPVRIMCRNVRASDGGAGGARSSGPGRERSMSRARTFRHRFTWRCVRYGIARRA